MEAFQAYSFIKKAYETIEEPNPRTHTNRIAIEAQRRAEQRCLSAKKTMLDA